MAYPNSVPYRLPVEIPEPICWGDGNLPTEDEFIDFDLDFEYDEEPDDEF